MTGKHGEISTSPNILNTGVEFFCDRVAILEKGHVIEALSADDMHKNVAHPTTRSLIDSVLSVSDVKLKI